MVVRARERRRVDGGGGPAAGGGHRERRVSRAPAPAPAALPGARGRASRLHRGAGRRYAPYTHCITSLFFYIYIWPCRCDSTLPDGRHPKVMHTMRHGDPRYGGLLRRFCIIDPVSHSLMRYDSTNPVRQELFTFFFHPRRWPFFFKFQWEKWDATNKCIIYRILSN